MIQLELNKGLKLEHFFEDERYRNLKREYRRLIDRKIKVFDCREIDINNLQNYACLILNDKQLLADIYIDRLDLVIC